MRLLFITLLCTGLLLVFSGELCLPQDSDGAEDEVNQSLEKGRIGTGVASLADALLAKPKDNIRFGLGALQFFQSVEKLGQALYRHGLRSDEALMDIFPFEFPIPPNPNPEPLTYPKARQIMKDFLAGLTAAEATLAQIKSDSVMLPLHFALTSFDFDCNGKISENETLWRIYNEMNQAVELTEERARNFVIMLDAGDVYWLRGYCHLLSACLEFVLAHDESQLFNSTAHIFFENPETNCKFLKENINQLGSDTFIVDAIAFLHLLNFPVVEPERMPKVLEHLRQVTSLSRQSWQLYLAETDDNREWVPNPKQTGVIPEVKVSEDMIQQWLAFLDELDTLLAGEKLIPFWRGKKPVGVNLKRAFTEPSRFDLVLWVQGSAAAPYLEEGELTKGEFWQRLVDTFEGQFIGFAIWFN
ncbi:hypothetical protein ACFL54_05465 [Planctomycetota bacterium]